MTARATRVIAVKNRDGSRGRMIYQPGDLIVALDLAGEAFHVAKVDSIAPRTGHYLVRFRERSGRWGGMRKVSPSAVLDRVPPAANIDGLAYRLHALRNVRQTQIASADREMRWSAKRQLGKANDEMDRSVLG